MSAAIAKAQRASIGKARPAAGDRTAAGVRLIDTKALRLTVRRVKFAGSLLVGALMLGVASNAIVLQTKPAPDNEARNAVPATPKAEPLAPVSRVIERPVDAQDAGPAVAMPDVDLLPVGTISPDSSNRPKAKKRAIVARTHGHKTDTITAFLRDDMAQSAGASSGAGRSR